MKLKLKRELEVHLHHKFNIKEFKWGPRKNHQHLEVIFDDGNNCKLVVSCTPSDRRTFAQIAGTISKRLSESAST